MKKLLPLFVLICVASAFGQSRASKPTTAKKSVVRVQQPPKPLTDAEICSLCVSAHYDKVTGDTTFAGRPITVTSDGKLGFLIRTLRLETGSIMVSIKLAPRLCIDEKAKIQFLFKDGSRLETRSGNSTFNCDGEADIYFGGFFRNDELLETLQTKPIETMRVHTFKSSLQEDFSQSQSIELMNQLKCLDLDRGLTPEAPPPVPKTVSGGELNGKAISLPMPEIPPAAKAVRASGSVSVEVLIDESGSVVSASAVSGHPLLRSSAERAAKGARFPPTLLNGVPVKVTGIITYSFVP